MSDFFAINWFIWASPAEERVQVGFASCHVGSGYSGFGSFAFVSFLSLIFVDDCRLRVKA